MLGPPYRRYAIRASVDGRKLWLTDDGSNCDDAYDFTGWDKRRLVNYVDCGDAQHHADRMRNFARERKMRLRVVPVWEYPGGIFELRRRKAAS